MFATGCIDASVGEHQSLDWPASDNVGVDDFLDVRGRDAAVPDGIRINDEVGAVLTLVQTPGLVGSDFPLQSSLL
jgi:hypothetical protein